MRRILNAAALALTALTLIATSVSHPQHCTEGPLVPGPTQLAVDTACGPPGTVTLTLDPETCEVTLEGAAAVGLPSRGHSGGTSFSLQDDGASRHCECEERTVGEWNVRCYESEQSGCGGSYLPACNGTARVATP
jgi:hypothetical protein